MAFGQQAGPPATAKQLQLLLSLLQDAGHSDFRDARGPMGFTQRQAGGKFTRDEADTFIEHLETAAEAGEEPERLAPAPKTPRARAETAPAPERSTERATPAPSAPSAPSSPISAGDAALRKVASERLAAELQRRGWVVLEP